MEEDKAQAAKQFDADLEAFAALVRRSIDDYRLEMQRQDQTGKSLAELFPGGASNGDIPTLMRAKESADT